MLNPLVKQIIAVLIAFIAMGVAAKYVKNPWWGGMSILIIAGYAGWLIHKYEMEKPLTITVK